jgi:hypothetical protein
MSTLTSADYLFDRYGTSPGGIADTARGLAKGHTA